MEIDNNNIYKVTIDRPMGSSHPDYPALIYPVNYGYISGIIAPDGEEQDAYILGVDVPVHEFTGRRIAIVHRRDDLETKWIIVPENIVFNKQQIEEMIYFQEQYYDSYVEMLNDEMWDAFDEHENYLGYQIKRSMAKDLPEGVYHIVVMVYTKTRDGKILVTQRARNKTYPLKWEITGGSIVTGETPVEGAARELSEETGILQTLENFREIYVHVDKIRHCIYHCYLTCIPKEVPVKLQMGETMDYRFLDFTEFNKLVLSDRFVLSEQSRYILHKELMEEVLNENN
ncbi:MAG: NUDIX domain-containing protein [Lachnospira sp.]